MFDNSPKPWSNDPYAPQISPRVYFGEKMWFAGFLIGSIFYGIVIVLFFQCMATLLNPADRTRGGIRRWGFMAHTTVMFSIVTVYNTTNLGLQSLSYIDNREFKCPGSEDGTSGPSSYGYFTSNKPISVVPFMMFTLNYWLADGLLLYRCYIIYAMNHWVIAFPCLMYLASLAMGIGSIYQNLQPVNVAMQNVAINNFGKAYYSISLSLDVLLTLMIVARIALHSRDIRSAVGSLVRPNRLYGALVTILVESCAIYTASYLLFLGPWASGSPIWNAFFPMLVEAQVIAPFLIILRVANRSALTRDSIASGDIGSFHFKSQEKSNGGATLPDEHPMHSMEINREIPGEAGVEAATTIYEVSI